MHIAAQNFLIIEVSCAYIISISQSFIENDKSNTRCDERKKYEIEDETRILVMGENAVGGTACGEGEREEKIPNENCISRINKSLNFS